MGANYRAPRKQNAYSIHQGLRTSNILHFIQSKIQLDIRKKIVIY